MTPYLDLDDAARMHNLTAPPPAPVSTAPESDVSSPEPEPASSGSEAKAARSGGRGLSALCAAVLGRPLDKTWQNSNWGRRPLRPAQVRGSHGSRGQLAD